MHYMVLWTCPFRCAISGGALGALLQFGLSPCLFRETLTLFDVSLSWHGSMGLCDNRGFFYMVC